MSKRITIDPITRIEGHLRVDCEVEGGKVTKAWASGQMWRGVEQILLGRDPRDAWAITQRICGVCTTVHAIASVRAVENALQLEVPLNAQYIRNLIIHYRHKAARQFCPACEIVCVPAAHYCHACGQRLDEPSAAPLAEAPAQG